MPRSKVQVYFSLYNCSQSCNFLSPQMCRSKQVHKQSKSLRNSMTKWRCRIILCIVRIFHPLKMTQNTEVTGGVLYTGEDTTQRKMHDESNAVRRPTSKETFPTHISMPYSCFIRKLFPTVCCGVTVDLTLGQCRHKLLLRATVFNDTRAS